MRITPDFTSLLEQRDTLFPPAVVATLHFRGDICKDVVGQCIGTEQMMTAMSASYDSTTNRTTVQYRAASMADIEDEMRIHGIPVPNGVQGRG